MSTKTLSERLGSYYGIAAVVNDLFPVFEKIRNWPAFGSIEFHLDILKADI